MFEKLEARNMSFKNRIIMPPMATAKADDKGHVSQDILDYYDEKTCDGMFSTVIVEHNFVDPLGKASHNQMSIADDSSIEGLKKLAKVIKDNGSKAVVQINHAGSAAREKIIGQRPVGPSEIKNPSQKDTELPRELTIDEIKEIEDKFADAALRVKKAGFDGVEIHSAHGYLLNQFLSPLTNKREDEYGGDIKGRIKIHLEIIKKVIEKLGEDYPIFLRLGAGDGKEDVKGYTIYDPTMGSGSLLLNVRNFSNEPGRIRYFGQELNNSTYNLSRMNMILHEVALEYQSLNQGNTLSDDWPVDEPTNFDAVLMNPPYSAKWDASKGFLDDPRFAEYGVLPPKSRADFAFLLHGFYHLKNTGTMAILLPHGVLFRSGAEEKIRKIMLENGSIDAVIGLAPNLFYSTGIPVSLIILKKDKTDRSVYFIDASEEFVKKGNKNELTEDNIQKIFKAYKSREEIDKFAHLAKFDEIEENGFNLNIPRYVDTFEEEEPIDLAEVSKEIKTINEESDKLKAAILADMRNLVANTDEAKTELEGFMEILGGIL